MALLFESDRRPVDSILHPTDLSEASVIAYHHALALGLRYGAEFTLLHALGRRATDSWESFPSTRETVARWKKAGTLEGLGPRVAESSISKMKIAIPDPIAAAKDHLTRNRVDMLVVATESRRGLSRLLPPSRAELLARETMLTTLFVPSGGKPFVSGATGALSLNRILVPVSPHTDPQPAMLFAVHTAAIVDDPSVEIMLLYVGEGDDQMEAEAPDLPFCTWRVMRRNGDPGSVILEVADEIDADAVVMSTAWKKPKMLGSGGGGVTEAVLASVGCPLAAIPVHDS